MSTQDLYHMGSVKNNLVKLGCKNAKLFLTEPYVGEKMHLTNGLKFACILKIFCLWLFDNKP